MVNKLQWFYQKWPFSQISEEKKKKKRAEEKLLENEKGRKEIKRKRKAGQGGEGKAREEMTGCVCKSFFIQGSSTPPLPPIYFRHSNSGAPPSSALNFTSLGLKASQSHAHGLPWKRFNAHSVLPDNGGWDGGGGGGPFESSSWWWHEDGDSSLSGPLFFSSLLLCAAVCCFCHLRLACALASSSEECEAVWEVRGGKWTKLVPDFVQDAFVIAHQVGSGSLSAGNLWLQSKHVCMRLMLPEGYPDSVTSDYLEYSLWRGVQGVASQISGVLATQVLACLSPPTYLSPPDQQPLYFHRLCSLTFAFVGLALRCWIGKRSYSYCRRCQLGPQGWNWIPQQNHAL